MGCRPLVCSRMYCTQWHVFYVAGASGVGDVDMHSTLICTLPRPMCHVSRRPVELCAHNAHDTDCRTRQRVCDTCVCVCMCVSCVQNGEEVQQQQQRYQHHQQHTHDKTYALLQQQQQPTYGAAVLQYTPTGASAYSPRHIHTHTGPRP